MAQASCKVSLATLVALLYLLVGMAPCAFAAPVVTSPGDGFDPPDTARSLAGFVGDADGKPLSGVRLIITGKGEVATGGDGRFVVNGVQAGITYGLIAQRTGVSFENPTLTGRVGDFLSLQASSVVLPPEGCTIRSHALALAQAAQIANRLREDTIVMARRIPAHQRLRLLSGEVIRAVELPQRVELQFANYSALSSTLPEYEFRCPDDVPCSEDDLRAAKLFMGIELENLSHERLLVNRILARRGRLSGERRSSIRRSVVSLRNRARSAVDDIRNYSALCLS